MFRPAGPLHNSPKPRIVVPLETMLKYRDTFSEPPTEGFSLSEIMKTAKAKLQAAAGGPSGPVAPQIGGGQPSPTPVLQPSQNAFKKADARSMTKEEVILRKVQGVLNKLTPEKYDALQPLVLFPELFEEAIVSQIVKRVFEKALDEPMFASSYARLCSDISKYENSLEGRDHLLFRRQIISHTQTVFESTFDSHESEETEEEQVKFRKRKVANVNFIGWLYYYSLINTKILPMIFRELLFKASTRGEVPGDVDAEVAIALLNTIGLVAEQRKFEELNTIFSYLKDLVDKEVFPKRIHYLVMNLIDLRNSGWARTEKEGDKVPEKAPPQRVVPEEKVQPKVDKPQKPVVVVARSPTTKGSPDFGAAKASTQKDAAAPPRESTPKEKGSGEDLIKREKEQMPYGPAYPPTVSPNAYQEVIEIFQDAACADEASMEHALNDAFAACDRALPDLQQSTAKMTAVYIVATFASRSSNEATTKALFGALSHPVCDRSQVYRGMAWALVKSITDEIMCDVPRFHDRFAAGALILAGKEAAAKKDLFRDVFGRAAGYIDQLLEPMQGGPEWDEGYMHAWECLVKRAFPPPVTNMNAVFDMVVAAVKVNTSFGQSVLPAIFNALIQHKICTMDNVKAWKAAKKGDAKAESAIAALKPFFAQ